VFWNFLKNHAKKYIVHLENYEIPISSSGIVANARKVITENMPETTENKDFEVLETIEFISMNFN
jgi:hypothetical protein